MAGEREHILEVLEQVESRLSASDRSPEAGRIALIRRALSSEQPLDAALETLYGVHGYSRFALRLMWYADKARDPFASAPTPLTVSRRADELLSLLPADETAPTVPVHQAPKSLKAAVDEFGVTMEAVKRETINDGRFSALTGEMAGRLRSSAGPLARSAGLEENRDVVRFAEAVARFLDVVQARELTHDVRVVNLLDSANLTLQTVTQTHAAEDYDSLQEITRLLENPLPLFEQPPASEQA